MATAKLPDPKGRIARAKAHMPVACSVRKSRFCDDIIAMRLQGCSYRKIEEWLRGKGLEHVIPAATLCRNLIGGLGKEETYLPTYEQVAETMGGEIPLDPARTLAGQALLQRLRIDAMIRTENDRRRVRPGSFNPRIRQEMETYLTLVEAAAKFAEGLSDIASDPSKGNSNLDEAAEEAIAELIMSGSITVPGTVVATGKAPLRLVGGS